MEVVLVYPLQGNWHVGAAFDLHTLSSTYLGPNEFGHDTFDNTRSEMGQLVYDLKYKSDPTKIAKIINLLSVFEGLERYDLFVPIPQTNKARPIDPVAMIASALGENRGVPVVLGNLVNNGSAELKAVSDPLQRHALLKAALHLNDPATFEGKEIILIDDLYRSGSTLRAATDLLYKLGRAKVVSVVTMTKTRSNR